MNRYAPSLFLFLAFAALYSPVCVQADAIIIDHTRTNINAISPADVVAAKNNLHIAYGHTSHGSQLVTGMSDLVGFMNSKKTDAFPDNAFTFNNGGSGGALDLRDTPFSGANDLGAPNYTAWATSTRNYLNANPTVNVIIWSWCGQADTSAANINTYLSLMNGLETDYQSVSFVYMTGHLVGTGATGNLNLRNQQIRDYCNANNKILYDFADIESYDPDGLTNYMALKANDNCDYDSDGNGSLDRNWALDWQSSHVQNVDWYATSTAHSQSLNGNRKAYAAWALWTEIATRSTPGDFNLDGAVDDLDYDIWIANAFKGTTRAQGDANGDGAVNGLDRDIWFANHGGVGAAAAAAPEPGTIVLLATGLMGLLAYTRRRRQAA